ncbi:hypothetical protein EO98_03770 [Methanosarcina sp. 2.H.T.1A.6]|uniref:class I SAM-dependent methyltransferase n=1 Tax=unclassified Methanosarcina TaxID=2644672 RepID=UPI000621D43E|nr:MULTISPECIES: class I SAM-dependent methyltransferase [unclassified Methanosarcina]KKG14869.1 hypothetical protein EO97_07045 [Methanosarcina sp. 2.H.T.1A.15]KKG19034.1 hypothetical protein EO94_06410 [Methanosarcina sp. 2.H.T.1A.3]KKG20842.1 hypothetical protein EO98_03770 [Methanosarcina sp. 2.H.T.1A.6]KKG22239.1 hypothetical protein EO96_06715 [Methanosarcina sp. 2.H.T.1A.8]
MVTKKVDWEALWADTLRATNEKCTPDYWNQRASDYSDFISTSDFEHGKKIRALFEAEGLLNKDWNILDVGAGPGAVTIPFAEKVSSVTSVEPAEEMANYLLKNAEERGLFNIRIIPTLWQEVEIENLRNTFDLVVCCHALWHFTDIWEQVQRMAAASKGFCCLVHGLYDEGEAEEWKKLGVTEDNVDQFTMIKNILEHRGIYPNIHIADITMRRSVESALSMWTNVLGKYRIPSEKDIETIKEYVNAYSNDGYYERKTKLGMLWWKTE